MMFLSDKMQPIR